MPFVYILASARNGTIYVGVTKDLIKRVHQHKADAVESFTQHYGIHDLVWYEHTDSIISAIYREKQLKNWKREWKIRLIEASNPQWQDLYPGLLS